jgi:hypothetical protein
MSDIDRVFARLGRGQPAGGDQRELRSIPRRRGSTGSRVVEVVRLPARGASPGRASSDQPGARVRAQTWDDGFPAKHAPSPSQSPLPVAAEASEAVAHVMPMWTRAVVEPGIEPAPAPPSEPAQATTPPPAKRTRRTANGASRRVADPFDPDDAGTNCLRCGYLIQPARERRGLMTCAECG